MAERLENFLTTDDLQDKLRDKHKSESDIKEALEQVEQASENIDKLEALQHKETREVKDFFEKSKINPNITIPGFSEAQLEELDRLQKREQADKHRQAMEDAKREYERFRQFSGGTQFEVDENLSEEAFEILQNFIKADNMNPPSLTESGDTNREIPTTRDLNESKEYKILS